MDNNGISGNQGMNSTTKDGVESTLQSNIPHATAISHDVFRKEGDQIVFGEAVVQSNLTPGVPPMNYPISSIPSQQLPVDQIKQSHYHVSNGVANPVHNGLFMSNMNGGTTTHSNINQQQPIQQNYLHSGTPTPLNMNQQQPMQQNYLNIGTPTPLNMNQQQPMQQNYLNIGTPTPLNMNQQQPMQQNYLNVGTPTHLNMNQQQPMQQNYLNVGTPTHLNMNQQQPMQQKHTYHTGNYTQNQNYIQNSWNPNIQAQSNFHRGPQGHQPLQNQQDNQTGLADQATYPGAKNFSVPNGNFKQGVVLSQPNRVINQSIKQQTQSFNHNLTSLLQQCQLTQKDPLIEKMKANLIMSNITTQDNDEHLNLLENIKIPLRIYIPAAWKTEKGYVAYKLCIYYQRHHWVVWKRFRSFQNLHKVLNGHKNSSIKNYYNERCAKFMPSLPFYRVIGSSTSNPFDVRKRISMLQKWLCAVFSGENKEIWSSYASSFLALYSLTPISVMLGRKGKEGYLRKLGGGHVRQSTLGDYIRLSKIRYFRLSETAIVYYFDHTCTKIKGILDIDPHFKAIYDEETSSIRLENNVRCIHIAADLNTATEWIEAIYSFYGLHDILRHADLGYQKSTFPSPQEEKMMKIEGSDICFPLSKRAMNHPCNSFAPFRSGIDVKYYVSGKEMMSAACWAMLNAKDTIYIAAWWLHPELYITRPPEPAIRLDRLLAYKAEEGIKICVMLYKEVEMALKNASAKAQEYLSSLHPNIYVITHPNDAFSFSTGSKALFWSHHDKIVCIDHSLAFVGGVDMAPGRWDDTDHKLSDPMEIMYLNDDYYNPNEGSHFEIFKRTVISSRNSSTFSVQINSASLSEMQRNRPSSKEANNSRLLADSNLHRIQEEEKSLSGLPYDTTLNSIDKERLNVKTKSKDDVIAIADLSSVGNDMDVNMLGLEDGLNKDEDNEQVLIRQKNDIEDGDDEKYDIRVSTTTNQNTDALKEIIAQDNPFESNPVESQLSQKSSLSGTAIQNPENSPKVLYRDTMPRMPWHDVHVSFGGEAARDVDSYFVTRWNHHRMSKGEESKYPILMQIQDNFYFGICFRCRKNVHEAWRNCFYCKADIGYVPRIYHHLYPEEEQSSLLDEEKQRIDNPIWSDVSQYFSEKKFQNVEAEDFTLCYEGPRLGLTIAGKGPVIVVGITSSKLHTNNVVYSGTEKIDTCKDGDVILSITYRQRDQRISGIDLRDPLIEQEGTFPKKTINIEHLSYEKVQDLFIRLPRPLEITFRRYRNLDVPETVSNIQQKLNIQEKDSTKDLTKTEKKRLILINNLVGLEKHYFSFYPYALHHLMSQYQDFKRIEKIKKSIPIGNHLNGLYGKGTCDIQVLRSCGGWSIGASAVEQSVQEGYLSCIKNASHFIYIENQFFCQNRQGDKNEVIEALFNRICSAIEKNEVFRVIILLPQHPEGDYINAKATQMVMHFQYNTISRGPASILERLRIRYSNFPRHVNLNEYISFFCLRQWELMPDQMIALEQIYIHSKVMIVDDEVAIVGSANINDRSMLGERDSEIAVLLRDRDRIASKMNGKEINVAKTIYELRTRLWRNHLGLGEDNITNVIAHDDNGVSNSIEVDIADPICHSTYDSLWLERAKNNTDLLELHVEGPSALNSCSKIEDHKAALIARANMFKDSLQTSDSSGVQASISGHNNLSLISSPKSESERVAEILEREYIGFVNFFPLNYMKEEEVPFVPFMDSMWC